MYVLQCPTCDTRLEFESQQDAPHRPFCSKRCQLIDLHKWFEGEYRVSTPIDPQDAVADNAFRQDNISSDESE